MRRSGLFWSAVKSRIEVSGNMEKKVLTCIGCPMGCELQVEMEG